MTLPCQRQLGFIIRDSAVLDPQQVIPGIIDHTAWSLVLVVSSCSRSVGISFPDRWERRQRKAKPRNLCLRPCLYPKQPREEGL